MEGETSETVPHRRKSHSEERETVLGPHEWLGGAEQSGAERCAWGIFCKCRGMPHALQMWGVSRWGIPFLILYWTSSMTFLRHPRLPDAKSRQLGATPDSQLT